MTKTYMTWLNYRQWQMIQNDCERCIVHACQTVKKQNHLIACNNRPGNWSKCCCQWFKRPTQLIRKQCSWSDELVKSYSFLSVTWIQMKQWQWNTNSLTVNDTLKQGRRDQVSSVRGELTKMLSRHTSLGSRAGKTTLSSSKSGSSEARVDQMAFMTFSMKSRLTGVGERLESRSCSPAASKTYKTRMLLSCDPRSLHTRISLIIFANFSRLIEPSMVRHWDFTCLRADSTAFSMASNLPAFSGLFSFSMFSLGSKLTRAADLAMPISSASWSSAATVAGLKICFQIFSMSDRSRTSSRGCWCLTACLIASSKTSP